MYTVHGGNFIHVYICPNHPNERWDVHVVSEDEPLYCLPCEMKRIREENKQLKQDKSSLIAMYRERQIEEVALRTEIKKLEK